jgi:phosphoribosylglycinamide formyltransferase 2
MAKKVTEALSGAGLFGVEFFLSENGVYFSELSPRPHDTGMVTLANTQNLNEFELHARAVLGLPIAEINLEKAGVSAVILAKKVGQNPLYHGIDKVLKEKNTDIKIFGKPSTRPFRRMAIVLKWAKKNTDIKILIAEAQKTISFVEVE